MPCASHVYHTMRGRTTDQGFKIPWILSDPNFANRPVFTGFVLTVRIHMGLIVCVSVDFFNTPTDMNPHS
jgi:hypothetical protein